MCVARRWELSLHTARENVSVETENFHPFVDSRVVAKNARGLTKRKTHFSAYVAHALWNRNGFISSPFCKSVFKLLNVELSVDPVFFLSPLLFSVTFPKKSPRRGDLTELEVALTPFPALRNEIIVA